MFERTLSRRTVSRTRRPAGRHALIEAIETRRYCDSDNSFGTAANLGTVNTIVTKDPGGLTSGSDTKDFYKFTVPSNVTTFKANLSGLTSNANLYLYNSSHTQIGSSTNGGNAVDFIQKQPLSAGTYYAEVRLASGAGSTSYKLDLVSDTAGSNTGSARNVGTLSGTKTYNEYVGFFDSGDYYKFNTSGNGVVNVTLNGLSGDAKVELLNSGGTVIQSNSKSGTAAETFVYGAASGTYYLRVVPAGASTASKYTLSFSKTAIPFDSAGSTFGTAATIWPDADGDVTTNGILLNGFNQVDTYKVIATEPGLVYASIGGVTDDLDVILYNGSGTELSHSSAGGFLPNFVAYDSTQGGTFYLKVVQHTTGSTGSASKYTLSVHAPHDQAGDTLSTPTPVVPDFNISTAVGGVDAKDFYSFATPDAYYITMQVTNAAVPMRLRFYDIDGTNSFTRTTSGGDTEELTLFVHTGGTFRVSVETIGATGGTYDLRIDTQAF